MSKILLLPLALLLSACGQKGPLYLPQEAAQPAPRATAPAAGEAQTTQPPNEEPQKEESRGDSEKPAVEEPTVEK